MLTLLSFCGCAAALYARAKQIEFCIFTPYHNKMCKKIYKKSEVNTSSGFFATVILWARAALCDMA